MMSTFKARLELLDSHLWTDKTIQYKIPITSSDEDNLYTIKLNTLRETIRLEERDVIVLAKAFGLEISRKL